MVKKDRSDIEKIAEKIIEAHSKRGTTGIIDFAKENPQYEREINAVWSYISKNFERCWPGDLEKKEHYNNIIKYISKTT